MTPFDRLLAGALAVCALLAICPAPATPASVEEVSGKVIGVTDGDTIEVLVDRTPMKVRLQGIDAPEQGQDYGQRAKHFVSAQCFGKPVVVSVLGKDRYGRVLGDVALSDGRVLNHEIVQAGLAWWYQQYAPRDDLLRRLQEEARTAKRGLWGMPNPTPPWEWRHRKRK